MEGKLFTYLQTLPAGNELLWLLMLVVNFVAILLVYRFFGRVGLYTWLPIAVIIANIQVLKLVQIFGITASLGNIVYATSFLATDILSENYGKRDATLAIGVGFFSLLSLTLFMNIALLFNPSPLDSAHESMLNLYAILPRLSLASFIAYGLSQSHDVWLYALIKKYQPEQRWIWLRNNLSTILSQAIDSVIFVLIAFAGSIPWAELWQIALSTYLLKGLVALADTPLVYLAAHWKKIKAVREA